LTVRLDRVKDGNVVVLWQNSSAALHINILTLYGCQR